MYKNFIEQIVKNQVVFALKNKKEVAVCPSAEFFVEETGEAIAVFPFWSEETMAKSCQEDEWSDYQIEKIKLSEFMEFWCLGMYEDSVAVGINFDANLSGAEETPDQLLKDIIKEIERTNTQIKFQNFVSLNQLRSFFL
ncbi:DUF2750 domain-containing protein [Capnocytophaga canis]|uniref:DUF2750 domain-containing protein n=1 Tax=Capnocytophaga canis TaxID=1848903 RepID=UPI001562D26E|nr:DUF2750 domain-containing protein [Capnocytophaga canis]